MGTQLEYVKHFKDLEVYRRQRLLAGGVFSLSKHFPREEQYSLTDQVRRSSHSIGAQIAEAWAKRLYPKHFISKPTDANGELMETQLGSMIRKAESFSSRSYTLHEAPPPCLTTDY